jgi:predicted TIM-barrel fold metal-dependent hydrolase
MTTEESPVIDFRVRLPEELRPARESSAARAYTSQYEAVFGPSMAAGREKTLADLVAEMDESGVERAVIHNEYETGAGADPAEAMNDALARVIGQHPGRFEGFGCVSTEPVAPMRAYRQVQQIAELGFIGVTIEPAFQGVATDDRRFYPLYAKASELGLAVAVHSGVNYTLHQPMINSHPMQLDQVACDFPELVLIACHGGWPWTAELVAVARKHPNVFIEFGGIAPKYIAQPGTGWDVMHRFMNTLLGDRVLHGTDWPTMSMARVLAEWREADIRPAVREGLLGGNAARLIDRLRTGR